MVQSSESRAALRELIALLEEIDERYLGDEWGVAGVRRPARRLPQRREHARGRLLPRLRQRPGAAVLPADRDAAPARCSATTPTRSTTRAPVRADRTYRVTGNMAGAVYLSFTVEKGTAEGGYSTETAGVLRDARLRRRAPTAASRSSSAAAPATDNWLELPDRRVGAHRALLLRGGRAGRRRPEPRSCRSTIETARTGRTAGAVGRRVGRGGLATGRDVPAQPHARASRSPANVSSPRGCRRRRTCSRRPSCPATSRSPRSTPRTRWRRTCSARRGARDDRPLARVPRSPTCRSGTGTSRPTTTSHRPARPEPGEHDARARRSLPHRDRARGPGRAQLDRHRGARLRDGVLAVLPARRRDRDAAGERS